MRRIELIALRLPKVPWSKLEEDLPPTLEAMGLVPDDQATHGELAIEDHGDEGTLVSVDSAPLARRIAVALAKRTGQRVELYEVVGTRGEKRIRFRTTAVRAAPTGALEPFEGKELDLEDDKQTLGGGGLEAQAKQVMKEFANLEFADQSVRVGYRKKPKGKPSSPRIASLLKILQKARSHEPVVQPNGRVELRIELAAGGKQTSFCTAEEYEELERLL